MKISIVVSKALTPGQKANVSAIIMGQLGRDVINIYTDVVADASGAMHAGISVNVVVLEGGEKQLLNLIKGAQESDVGCVVFSATGQSLSNSYEEYKAQISASDTESTKIVGVGVYGEDATVKTLTKKFSLAK